MESDRRRQFHLLITYPRSASNLLVRILALEKQPNIVSRQRGGYFFLPAVLLINEMKTRGKHLKEWMQDDRSRMFQTYQNCFNELEELVEKAKAHGKIAYVKEHSYFMTEPTAETRFLFGQSSIQEPPWTVQVPRTYASKVTHSSLNETVLPDEFLHIWLPTFLIRHPALVFPSCYRTVIDNKDLEAPGMEDAELPLMMTLHWTRTLYDWYTQHLSESESRYDGDISWPLVLEADDIMTEPEVLVRYCEIVGMDPEKLQFTWSPASKEELAQLPNDIVRRMLSTISASDGIVSGKTSINLDIDTEAKKWREEFGEREGEKIEKWVRAAMPDYEYMKARRLRPKVA